MLLEFETRYLNRIVRLGYITRSNVNAVNGWLNVEKALKDDIHLHFFLLLVILDLQRSCFLHSPLHFSFLCSSFFLCLITFSPFLLIY
jgi:hypothetical protein